MTQAVNLANFANNLDTSGGMNPSAINAPVPVSKGGTGGTTATGSGIVVLATSPTLISPTLTSPTVSTSLSIGSAPINTTNFSIVESGGKLFFKYGSTAIASMDSSGNFISLANITAYGTP